MKHKKVAVILSGCGVYDGAEINEVVLTLLALEDNHMSYQCFAPDIAQHHVINHITGATMPEKRNILIEAARIVRGNIKPIIECEHHEFSAVIVPGGFGVAKNLSTFAFHGAELTIDPQVSNILNQFKKAAKPAGYICIAPTLLPHIYGTGVILTIGNDAETIAAVEKMGAIHRLATVNEIVIDHTNKVVTTPAYMLANSITEAKIGIDKLVSKINKMID